MELQTLMETSAVEAGFTQLILRDETKLEDQTRKYLKRNSSLVIVNWGIPISLGDINLTGHIREKTYTIQALFVEKPQTLTEDYRISLSDQITDKFTVFIEKLNLKVRQQSNIPGMAITNIKATLAPLTLDTQVSGVIASFDIRLTVDRTTCTI